MSRSSEAVSSGSGQIDHGAQQLRRHVVPDHRRRLEHVLVARREPIDARREDGLDGLGQRDLLDLGGRRVRAALAARASPRSTSERTISSTKRGLPGARASIRARSGASAGSGPSQSSSKRRGVPGGERRKREMLDPAGPCGPVFGPRGREHQDPGCPPTPERGPGR